MALHSHAGEVTERIRLRSRDGRAGLACGNLAQGFAPCSAWGST